MNQLKHISGILLLMLVVFFITCKKDTVPQDTPPIAKAGSDQTILLPNDTAKLSGEGSGDADDPRDKVTAYYWRKISGPPSSQIDSPSKKITVVRKLVPGIYHFELKATDVQGLSSTDTVQISERTAGVAPIANAGPDTLVIFNFIGCTNQTFSITLDGSGSYDPDHTPLTYIWTQIKGNSAQIISPQTAKTDVANVLQGDYEFELSVSDAGGKSSRDTVRIRAVTSPPPAYDLNVLLASNYTFQDNFKDSIYGYPSSYYDLVTFSGPVNIQLLGDFYFDLSEYSDTSNLSEDLKPTLNLYNVNGYQPFLNGECSFNFKKIIVNGGGSFSGTWKITDGSAMACNANILKDLSPLSITGTVDTTMKTITMTIKGKVYF